jgi:ADP-ribosylglycohydrolase
MRIEDTTARPTRLERVRGCLLGGAIGDALGAGIEFASLAEITRNHGPAGVDDFVHCYGRDVAITDDTQMTLFTAEGLVNACRNGTNPEAAVWEAYLRWYDTQARRSAGEDLEGLAALPDLRVRRAPGNTCLGALSGGRPGTTTTPLNNSKGCGGVMRVAPVAFVVDSAAEAWELGCATAALTHGHRNGWASAGALAVMLWEIDQGADLPAAVQAGRAVASADPQGADVAGWIDAAVRLAEGQVDGAAIDNFGAGWVGEEALGIAVACALAHGDPNDAILAAVNHSGDSDSTGSIVGQLLGTAYGVDAFRSDWVKRIELREVIEQTAAELADCQNPDGDS